MVLTNKTSDSSNTGKLSEHFIREAHRSQSRNNTRRNTENTEYVTTTSSCLRSKTSNGAWK